MAPLARHPAQASLRILLALEDYGARRPRLEHESGVRMAPQLLGGSPVLEQDSGQTQIKDTKGLMSLGFGLRGSILANPDPVLRASTLL